MCEYRHLLPHILFLGWNCPSIWRNSTRKIQLDTNDICKTRTGYNKPGWQEMCVFPHNRQQGGQYWKLKTWEREGSRILVGVIRKYSGKAVDSLLLHRQLPMHLWWEIWDGSGQDRQCQLPGTVLEALRSRGN